MVTKQKALISLTISSLVILFRLLIYTNLNDLLYISPILIVYCLFDMNNSRDMQIHHFSTILLNITFYYYVISNQKYLNQLEQQKIEIIVTSFLDIEVSTISLAFIHLGYKSIYNKLCFLCLFIYFRIIKLTINLFINYQIMNNICQTSYFCYFCWYVGSIPIIILNYYWFSLIINKLIVARY